jgi:hypothetical protein
MYDTRPCTQRPQGRTKFRARQGTEIVRLSGTGGSQNYVLVSVRQELWAVGCGLWADRACSRTAVCRLTAVVSVLQRCDSG